MLLTLVNGTLHDRAPQGRLQQPEGLAVLQGLSTEPSMGMAWYLAAEAFPRTLQACHTGLLLVPWLALLPMAACLHQEPLLLWTLAALGGCTFRAAPNVTDLTRCLVSLASNAACSVVVSGDCRLQRKLAGGDCSSGQAMRQVPGGRGLCSGPAAGVASCVRLCRPPAVVDAALSGAQGPATEPCQCDQPCIWRSANAQSPYTVHAQSQEFRSAFCASARWCRASA